MHNTSVIIFEILVFTIKINPQHVIPTLITVTGASLWESRAIMTYLVEKYGKDDVLYPSEPLKCALIRVYISIWELCINVWWRNIIHCCRWFVRSCWHFNACHRFNIKSLPIRYQSISKCCYLVRSQRSHCTSIWNQRKTQWSIQKVFNNFFLFYNQMLEKMYETNKEPIERPDFDDFILLLLWFF